MRCYLQFSELGGFVWREWDVFERLRLCHIRIRKTALGRRPQRTLNHFGRCAFETRSFVYYTYTTFVLVHDWRINSNTSQPLRESACT